MPRVSKILLLLSERSCAQPDRRTDLITCLSSIAEKCGKRRYDTSMLRVAAAEHVPGPHMVSCIPGGGNSLSTRASFGVGRS